MSHGARIALWCSLRPPQPWLCRRSSRYVRVLPPASAGEKAEVLYEVVRGGSLISFWARAHAALPEREAWVAAHIAPSSGRRRSPAPGQHGVRTGPARTGVLHGRWTARASAASTATCPRSPARSAVPAGARLERVAGQLHGGLAARAAWHPPSATPLRRRPVELEAFERARQRAGGRAQAVLHKRDVVHRSSTARSCLERARGWRPLTLPLHAVNDN